MLTETDRLNKSESGEAEVRVGFRVMGSDLEPSEVSRLLGLQATESHKRGDARIGQSGRRYSDYSEGLWAWQPPVSETAPLAEHLNALVDVLGPKAALLQRLREWGLRMDIFVGLFGPDSRFGFVLSPELLHRLGDLGIAVDFDVYCC